MSISIYLVLVLQNKTYLSPWKNIFWSKSPIASMFFLAPLCCLAFLSFTLKPLLLLFWWHFYPISFCTDQKHDFPYGAVDASIFGWKTMDIFTDNDAGFGEIDINLALNCQWPKVHQKILNWMGSRSGCGFLELTSLMRISYDGWVSFVRHSVNLSHYLFKIVSPLLVLKFSPTRPCQVASVHVVIAFVNVGYWHELKCKAFSWKCQELLEIWTNWCEH